MWPFKPQDVVYVAVSTHKMQPTGTSDQEKSALHFRHFLSFEELGC